MGRRGHIRRRPTLHHPPRKTREQALEEAANGGDEPVDDSEARILDAAMRALTSGSPLDTALPIDWTGITPFRKQVLEECASIPRETRSYAWLAEQAGRPRAARAVGRVMATNPWPSSSPATASSAAMAPSTAMAAASP